MLLANGIKPVIKEMREAIKAFGLEADEVFEGEINVELVGVRSLCGGGTRAPYRKAIVKRLNSKFPNFEFGFYTVRIGDRSAALLSVTL